jgi:predicted ATP-grasp superfamily ATP-dependent carboligase
LRTANYAELRNKREGKTLNAEDDQLKHIRLQNLLVVGIDAAALAVSARKAGYTVYTVDFFGDQDVRRVSVKSLSVITQKPGKSCGFVKRDYSPDKLLSLARKLYASHKIDGFLLASGLEDSPQVLEELDDLIPILGNPIEIIRRVRDTRRFFHELKRLGIAHPETVLVTSLEEGKQAAKDIGYPVITKPTASSGGTGIRKANSREEFTKAYKQAAILSQEVLVQEFVAGDHVSVSLLSSRKGDVKVLTVNEQLLGIRELHPAEPFGYCGNIVPAPVNDITVRTCSILGERIATHFKLAGSNGVDIVVSEGAPHVIEVNPRFQGTIECVERVLRISLVDSHIDACLGNTLPPLDKAHNFDNCCVRLVLHAQERSAVPSLSDIKEVRDAPLPRAIVEKGEPLCSIVVERETTASALEKAKALARRIYTAAERRPH